MKKLFVIMYLSLLVVGCQKNIKKTNDVKHPVAQIEFPEGTYYDMGYYYEKVVKEHSYPIHNPGKVPLVIDSIVTFCGCTSAYGPKTPIMPGKTDSIRVVYDGNGFAEGSFAKTARIFSNADTIVDLILRGAYFEPIKVK